MKHAIATFALIALVTACAPGINHTPVSANDYFRLEIDGAEVPRNEGVFVYETEDYLLLVDLGRTQARSGAIAAVEAVGFTIQNNTDNRMLIVWDESSFVLPDGDSSRVYHFGVKYSQREQSQPPTVIAPGARVDEAVLPTDYTYYRSGGGGWTTIPIVNMSSPSEVTFRAFLSLEVNGEVRMLDMRFQRMKAIPIPEA